MVEDMLVILRSVQDPRDFTARHDLVELLFLFLCGLLCGEKTCVDLADFAAGHEAEFRAVLRLRHGTPSHDTLSRVPRLLDPDALEGALSACLAAMGASLRAYAAGERHMPPVMVGVFDGLTRLSLAQGRAGDGGETVAGRGGSACLRGGSPSHPHLRPSC